ncbi:MAG: HlyC/CorC family transporter [Candidatus Dadabacteria bacterium]|nr:HlyC/CorC family transporter [Candidatus Dadabacteria bacterium]NIV43216.1 DUF21 domain-containing protein [Candidatus Dadabacteria bacterium]NIX14800.1 DUF21 domain-containing protein [Candidatus Dadabacteria bacterium]
MEDISLSYNIFLIVILLLLSGFFCIAEGSLFSLEKHHIDKLLKEGKKSSVLIQRLLKDPFKLIITILFADEVVNVAYSSVIGLTVGSMLHGYPETYITLISIAIASPSLLLLGEIGPKTLGVKYPRLLASLISYPLNAFHIAITPIRWVIMILSVGFTRLFGGNIQYEHKKGYSMDEVKALVGLGSDEGIITEIENRLVDNLFQLEQVPAYKIMTPSIDCFFLPSTISPGNAIYEVKKAGFSRIPVYQGDKDNIIGILYAKDLLLVDSESINGLNLQSILRPPKFVPRTKMAFELLAEFQKERKHMAVVVDEYGRIDGILTMEDILEELFGEIEDERRVIKEKIVRREGRGFIIPGSVKIDEFNENYLFPVLRYGGIDKLSEEMERSELPSEEFSETLGGFVFDQFGKFPKEGEKVCYNSLLFTVNKVFKKRIAEIKVERNIKEVADVA